jgi:DNA-binding MarR family transcriptional regulator
MSAMDEREDGEGLALALAGAFNAVERRLTDELGAVRGISLAEYRLLHALASAPGSTATRSELSRVVGLAPSILTRALRPLEDRGIVSTAKNQSDARLAVVSLTPSGTDLLADTTGVIRDTMRTVQEQTPLTNKMQAELVDMLRELARV